MELGRKSEEGQVIGIDVKVEVRGVEGAGKSLGVEAIGKAVEDINGKGVGGIISLIVAVVI